MRLTDQKRQSILDAAIGEFQDNGFGAARITKIAARANVSTRTLYNHFDSKEALFEAIIDVVFAQNAAIQITDFDPELPVRDQLITAINIYIAGTTTEQHLGLNRIVMAEFLRDTALAKRAFAHVQAHDNPVEHLIAQAMNAGKLRADDPKFAARKLVSMVKTFFFTPLFLFGETTPLPRSDDAVIAECVDMFLGAYAP